MEVPAPPPLPEPAEPAGDDPLESQQVFLLILVLLLILCFSVGNYVTPRTKWLTEGSFACLVGLVGGLVMLLINVFGDEDYSISLAFDSEAFFDVLLPPIIFYQGYSMHKHRFFKNAAVITLFGLVGTIVSFLVISVATAALRTFSTRTCLRIGAIMAATDSVAVLQVLNPDRSPLLHSIVFGEGVINDASSIVLLRSIRNTYRSIGVDEALSGVITHIFFGFFVTFALSSLIGICIGLFSALLMRMRSFSSAHHQGADRDRLSRSAAPEWITRSESLAGGFSLLSQINGTHQVAFIFLLAYLAFVIAETLGLSGIMTLFVTGLVMSHYTHHNLEESAKITTQELFHALSLLSEVTIYIFVGMDSLYKGNWTNVNKVHVFSLILLLLLSILLARLVFVFPVCYLQNIWNRNKLQLADMATIVWAGTLRGAVSVALVIYSFAPNRTQGTKDPELADRESSTVIAAVMALVVFEIIVMGMVTKPVIRVFDGWRPPGSSSHRGNRYRVVENELELPLQRSPSGLSGIDSAPVTPPARGWLVRKWTAFDDQVMKPIFGGEMNQLPAGLLEDPSSSGDEQERVPDVCIKRENT